GMKAVHRVLDPGNREQIRAGLCALAVMTKAPQAGKVKTRLTPPLSSEEAAALNACFLRDTAAAIVKTAENGSARGIAVYTPVGAEAAYAEILPEEFELVPQRGGAFGERLVFATEDLLQLGFDSLCLIDSDSPTVPQQAFADAVELLSQPSDSLVLGPSDDGGYYLIGLKKLHRQLFEDIDWSTERVLEQTIERAREIDLPVHLLPTWYDVDDRATLNRLCQEFFGANGSARTGHPASATRQFLHELLQREGRQRIWPEESQP
ncbi:MAG: TIGR04282 family arsenosugar biosynthesis glycosyltransferase, partial [Verrucomicrobiaceae bacterium]|nr:TIGR04282 family arsenosugar biosynthesis glycosyltransferase [Verrucomicrobiaceae bacterium]